MGPQNDTFTVALTDCPEDFFFFSYHPLPLRGD